MLLCVAFKTDDEANEPRRTGSLSGTRRLSNCPPCDEDCKSGNKPTTPPQAPARHARRETHGCSVLISARFAPRQALRLRRRPSDGSCRSLRAWPDGLASLRSAAACRRRPWRATSPTPSPLTTSHRLPKPGTSVVSAPPRPCSLRPATPSRAVPARLGRGREPKGSASTITLVALAILAPHTLLLPLPRRASPSPMAGCQQLATAADQANHPSSTQVALSAHLASSQGRPHPDPTTPTTNQARPPFGLQVLTTLPFRTTQLTWQAGRQQGRRIPSARQSSLRAQGKPATLRSLAAALTRRAARSAPRSAPKGHSLRRSAPPPERRPQPIGPRPRPRKGKATRVGPTFCLLILYCLVPCSAHWCLVHPGPLCRRRPSFDRSALLRTITRGKGSSALRVPHLTQA
jgi:hypothetical protein